MPLISFKAFVIPITIAFRSTISKLGSEAVMAKVDTSNKYLQQANLLVEFPPEV
jgi:hypothetical protein